MANIFSSMYNNVIASVAGALAGYIQDPMGRKHSILHDYYNGDQRPQLKTTTDPKTGKTHDDNIIENRIGLNVDRSVSRLYRGGISFELPEGADAQQEYLDSVWDLNKKEILLYQVGLYGATDGTAYIKIRPDALLDPYTEKLYSRLVPLNPRTIRIKTAPDDVNEVEQYLIEYACMEERNGRQVEVLHREVTKHAGMEQHTDPAGVEYYDMPDTWVVEVYEQVGSMPMQLINAINWDYPFPPIIHWKNLPSLEGCYGDSEVDDTINLQDKTNFTISNTGKIIKFHASPTLAVTGATATQVQAVDVATGQIVVLPDKEAKIFVLESTSDLVSSRAFADDLRKAMSEISREVDSATLEKNMGAVTNFALRVLYGDALDKNDTKRQLYGDALLELNRRLLVLANYTGEASRPGSIIWGDPLPSNPLEEMQADKVAQDNGWIDKQSLANKWFDRYGVEWETIQENKKQDQPERIDNESLPDMQQQRQEGDTESLSRLQRDVPV